MKLLKAITVASVTVLGIVAISSDSFAQENKTCEARCEQDYSACGDDPNDPCNKAKKSCLEICKLHDSGTGQPKGEDTEPRQ